MPTYDKEVSPLMQRFIEANEREAVLLRQANEAGKRKDYALFIALFERVKAVHDHKMEIYEEMQQHRIED